MCWRMRSCEGPGEAGTGRKNPGNGLQENRKNRQGLKALENRRPGKQETSGRAMGQAAGKRESGG